VSEGWEPVPSGDQPAFGAWNTVGGQWRWSQIHCRRSPGPRSGALVDSRRWGRSSPPASRRWSTDPDEIDLDGRISHALSGPGAPAPTLRPSRPSTRTGRATGDTSSRRLSGGLMLVTTAVDPPRRPTSDPLSQLTIGTGCSLRRAPDDGTSRRDAVLVRAYLCWWPARSGVPAVGPRCDRPVGLSDRPLRYLACAAGRHRAPRPPERVNPLLSVREQRQVRQDQPIRFPATSYGWTRGVSR
jgi:hypothetical protein